MTQNALTHTQKQAKKAGALITAPARLHIGFDQTSKKGLLSSY